MTRRKGDTYYTPDALARGLVSTLQPYIGSGQTILEPHAGGGAFVRALRHQFPGVEVIAGDADPFAPAFWYFDEIHMFDGDFMDARSTRDAVDWIVGNPPFSDAEEHASKAIGIAREGVAFLLRLGFMSSQKRRAFWEEHPPASVHVLSERPSFTGGGTDKYDYAWITWRRGYRGPAALSWLSWREGGRRGA